MQPLAPGAKRQWEDWEGIHYALLVGTAAIVAVAVTSRSNVNVRDWARDEAEERVRRREVSTLARGWGCWAEVSCLARRATVVCFLPLWWACVSAGADACRGWKRGSSARWRLADSSCHC